MMLFALLGTALAGDITEDHVVSVLTSNEYGSSRRHTVRWAHSPTLAIIGGTEGQRQLAADIAATLSAQIAPLSLTIIDEPGAADVRMYFDDAETLVDIAQEEGFDFIPGNAGLFWCWWDRRGRLWKTVILIEDSWEADSAWMQHLLLEEMTQSLGLMNDSPLLADSVVYETASHPGSATSLSPVDQATLQLLYSLRPGTRKWRVRRAFRKM